MKKRGLLNQLMMSVIAGMGHFDQLVIADAGLPIPLSTQRIDLAVVEGVPSFLDVLQATLDEMQVEKVIIASEIRSVSPEMYSEIVRLLGDITIETVSHADFKAMTKHAHAIVRTGEFTPYCNIILVAGVVF